MIQDLIITTSLLYSHPQGGAVPAIAFVAFIFGFIVYIFTLLYCLSSYRWSKTDGVITVSELHESKQRPSGSYSTTIYRPIIRYTYEVNGQRYENKKIRFFQLNSSVKSIAESPLATFPEGASVPVYYNSKRPSSSVLVQGVSFGAFFVFSFFALSIWMITTYVM